MRITPIVASHLATLLLGLAAGNFYWASHRSFTQSVVADLTRRPLKVASVLAFRFGAPDDAKVLLQALRRGPAGSFSDADEMEIELRLAVLDGEQGLSASNSPHLQAASKACQRFRHSNCEDSCLRQVAARFARQRPRMP
jgi:hypothetical protein